ncbi:hypothetical protein KUW09_24775 [Mameliella alba]|nr:hypothetical protein [Antarctobacter heliothermus]MBY6147287.1 hypothetical protein [Mameliella alba]MCA0957357.1 hypothetical protein [Mameliella alba]
MFTNRICCALAAAIITAPFAIFPAQAAQKTAELNVKLKVNPMVMLFVTDSDMTMEAADLSSSQLDSTDAKVSEGRAQFWVVANTSYDITLEPEETWKPAKDLEVKFVGQADAKNYIGGQIFLDTDLSKEQTLQDGTDIISWDPKNGNVSHSSSARGVTRYGVGAIFDPQLWSGAVSEDDKDAPKGAQSIAPPDVYATTVTVTVTSN